MSLAQSGGKVRIGCGAGFSGDRIEPAVILAEQGDLDYLVFECLAERTIAMAVRTRLKQEDSGYDPLLVERLGAVLPAAVRNRVRIISNMGAANPVAAARRAAELAGKLGLGPLKIAAVTGDDVLAQLREKDRPLMDAQGTVWQWPGDLISANAYLGAEPIAQALAQGADIVITGRAADPSLFLAPLVHEFGWAWNDWEHLGRATVIGHLLECAGQITGGYFADPGFKDVPEPWNLAFPIVEAEPDGSVVLTKVAGTGGAVDLRTVKEQILYEVHDPANYITPDVVVDFTTAQLEQVGPNRVRVAGISGKPRTPTLKVSIGCTEGFIGEDMFFYAGPGALRRAQLAKRILEERFKIVGLKAEEVRIDFLGMNAIHGEMTPHNQPEPYEIAVRVAARTRTRDEAIKVGREVDGMAVSGVAMTGKRVPHQDRTREIIGVWSSLVAREKITPSITMYES